MGGYRSLLAFWIGGAASPTGVTVINVGLVPVGGCGGGPGFMIVGAPNSAASLLNLPVDQSLQVGVPVTASLLVGQRRRRPVA
jgi:hypothetical protein